MAPALGVHLAASLLSALVAAAALLPPSDTRLVVRLEEGLVRGCLSRTVLGRDYVRFSGIPYAEPPLGDLRFKAPVAKSPWQDVLNAVEEGPVCPQLARTGEFIGQEDCLYLNVYTPQFPGDVASDELLKVMVYIHGGGFTDGSGGRSKLGPDFFMQWDVILITFNYRLGALGFLSLETESVPGNYGLKDQNLALRWVRRNAQAFGGNPQDVTVFGESAGAASIHYHLLSPASRGLFTRAIAQSGSALNPWGFTLAARQRAISLAMTLGLSDGASDDEILDFLKRVSPQNLVNNATAALSERDRRRLFKFVFVPCVEPNIPGAFLTKEPAVLIAEDSYMKVPYITGVTSAECNFFVSSSGTNGLRDDENLHAFQDNFEAIIGPELRVKGIENQNQIALRIKEFYYGDFQITHQQDINTTHLLTDLYFEEGVDLVVRKMAETLSVPVYYYRFSFKGPMSPVPDQPGVSHAEDLKYLFYKIHGEQNLDPKSEERIIRERFLSMWINFAKYGNPTPNVTSLLPVKWKAYTKENPAFLDLNSTVTLDYSLDSERQEFWHSILPPQL